MLIHSASQLLTLTGGPQRGQRFGRLGMIENGAVLIQGETIRAIGPTPPMLEAYPHEERLDAENGVVMPGLVDPHTHLVWAGDRAAEFEMRLQGKTYLEILQAGGGILNTVRATRSASDDTLFSESRSRLKTLFRNGTTTAEVKTGYGLDTPTEIRQLEIIDRLNRAGPVEIIPTFLGAHAIPEEYRRENGQAYVELICREMLPAADVWKTQHRSTFPLIFADVFCEEGAFSLKQSRQILETAKKFGFSLKIHADEFNNLGGVQLAIELGAVSADHLVKISTAEIAMLASSTTAAVLLPATPFSLGEKEHAPARELIESGCLVALASDINPGTAWCESMQFIIALACRTLHLTPAEAVAAATINAAAAIGQEARIGSIETGKQADLLILSVSDYRHLAYRFGGNLVKTVIKKGKVFDFREDC